MKRLARVLAACILFLVPMLASAQPLPATAPPGDNGLNIEISPARLLLSGKPGTKIDASLKIRNRNAATEKLRLEVVKVEGKGDQIFLTQPGPDDEFPKWIKFAVPIPFDAPFNQFISVPISIDIPPTAAFGYYYAILISKANAPLVAPGTTQAIEGKVAQFILLDIDAPGAERTAIISEFTTDRKWYEFLPVNFQTKVDNTGNVHVAPRGNIFIKNMTGQQVGVLEVNSEQGNLLPGGSRSFPATWVDGFPHFETVNGSRRLMWNWNQLNWFRIGRFRAQVVLIYNDGQRDIPIMQSIQFWVIPWHILLVALIIFIIFITGLWLIIRSIIRRLRRKRSQLAKKHHEATTAADTPDQP